MPSATTTTSRVATQGLVGPAARALATALSRARTASASRMELNARYCGIVTDDRHVQEMVFKHSSGDQTFSVNATSGHSIPTAQMPPVDKQPLYGALDANLGAAYPQIRGVLKTTMTELKAKTLAFEKKQKAKTEGGKKGRAQKKVAHHSEAASPSVVHPERELLWTAYDLTFSPYNDIRTLAFLILEELFKSASRSESKIIKSIYQGAKRDEAGSDESGSDEEPSRVCRLVFEDARTTDAGAAASQSRTHRLLALRSSSLHSNNDTTIDTIDTSESSDVRTGTESVMKGSAAPVTTHEIFAVTMACMDRLGNWNLVDQACPNIIGPYLADNAPDFDLSELAAIPLTRPPTQPPSGSSALSSESVTSQATTRQGQGALDGTTRSESVNATRSCESATSQVAQADEHTSGEESALAATNVKGPAKTSKAFSIQVPRFFSEREETELAATIHELACRAQESDDVEQMDQVEVQSTTTAATNANAGELSPLTLLQLECVNAFIMPPSSALVVPAEALELGVLGGVTTPESATAKSEQKHHGSDIIEESPSVVLGSSCVERVGSFLGCYPSTRFVQDPSFTHGHHDLNTTETAQQSSKENTTRQGQGALDGEGPASSLRGPPPLDTAAFLHWLTAHRAMPIVSACCFVEDDAAKKLAIERTEENDEHGVDGSMNVANQMCEDAHVSDSAVVAPRSGTARATKRGRPSKSTSAFSGKEALVTGQMKNPTVSPRVLDVTLWRRRVGVMSTFAFIRRGQFDHTFRMAERLLDDPHDLIHKSVGWMLREIGKRDEAALASFLAANAWAMPRVMLRYATEKIDAAERKQYYAATGPLTKKKK